MIMRILHGHSACTVNSLVLSQSLTWWITKNPHSNGHLCHSFEQIILEDIQQTQVNIKHRAYLQNHFLGEPTVDPIFSQVIFFPGWRIPVFANSICKTLDDGNSNFLMSFFWIFFPIYLSILFHDFISSWMIFIFQDRTFPSPRSLMPGPLTPPRLRTAPQPGTPRTWPLRCFTTRRRRWRWRRCGLAMELLEVGFAGKIIELYDTLW